MFIIACIFDEESGVDCLDPFGDIKIHDGTATVNIRETYLDSWLAALLETLNQIHVGARFAVAIPEEPISLQVYVGADGKITVQYGEQVVIADSKSAFEGALLHACRSFLKRISQVEEVKSNSQIDKIKRVLAQRAGGADIDVKL